MLFRSIKQATCPTRHCRTDGESAVASRPVYMAIDSISSLNVVCDRRVTVFVAGRTGGDPTLAGSGPGFPDDGRPFDTSKASLTRCSENITAEEVAQSIADLTNQLCLHRPACFSDCSTCRNL